MTSHHTHRPLEAFGSGSEPVIVPNTSANAASSGTAVAAVIKIRTPAVLAPPATVRLRLSRARSAGFVWLAFAVSALMFAAGYLPAAAILLDALDVPVVAFVIGVNSAFGVLFGDLKWRYSLESAMIAHAMARPVSFVANLSWP